MAKLNNAHLNFGIPAWASWYTEGLILFGDVSVTLIDNTKILKVMGELRRHGEIRQGQKIIIPIPFTEDEKKKIDDKNIVVIEVFLSLHPQSGGNGGDYGLRHRTEVVLNFDNKTTIAAGIYGEAAYLWNNRDRATYHFDKEEFRNKEQFPEGVPGLTPVNVPNLLSEKEVESVTS